MWKRYPKTPCNQSGWPQAVGLLMVWGGFAGLLVAVLLFSPWLGALTAILSLGGTLLRSFGATAIRELSGPWLLLFALLTPPMGLDFALIHKLQRITSTWSSALLELNSTHHQLAGNVFRLPDRELFVAEACSGIHSQLVLIVVSLILAVVARRSWLHTALLVAASVFWSIAVNIVRVSGIVHAAAEFGLDLSAGWKHEVVGYGLILGALGLLVAFDRFLSAALAPIFSPKAASNCCARIWNSGLASWPASGEFSGSRMKVKADRSATAEGTVLSMTARQQKGRISKPFLTVAACLFSLGTLQITMTPTKITPDAAPQLKSVVAKTGALEGDWLAHPISEMSARPAYTFKTRDTSSDEGERSHIWEFQLADRSVLLAVDFPFVNWHSLEACYKNRGWREVNRRTVHADTHSGTGDFLEIDFINQTGQLALLQYGHVDFRGNPMAVPGVSPVTGQWLGSKLRSSPLLAPLMGLEQADSLFTSTVQEQLFTISRVPLNESERQQARQMFVKFREELSNRLQGFRKG